MGWRVSRLAWTLALAATITVASGNPAPQVELGFELPWDKLVHFLLYGLLATSLLRVMPAAGVMRRVKRETKNEARGRPGDHPQDQIAQNRDGTNVSTDAPNAGACPLHVSSDCRSLSPAVAGVITCVVVTLFGLSDELHQSLNPWRTFEWWDLAADGAGAIVAVVVYQKWPAYRRVLEFPLRRKSDATQTSPSGQDLVMARGNPD